MAKNETTINVNATINTVNPYDIDLHAMVESLKKAKAVKILSLVPMGESNAKTAREIMGSDEIGFLANKSFHHYCGVDTAIIEGIRIFRKVIHTEKIYVNPENPTDTIVVRSQKNVYWQ